MKKSLLFIFTLIFSLAQGQSIPNGDFENWETVTIASPIPIPGLPSITYKELSQWQTLNSVTTFTGGSPSALQIMDPQSGNSALKLQTVKVTFNGEDTVPATAVTSFSLSNYAPSIISGYYKCDFQEGEEGQMIATGTSQDSTFIMGLFSFSGKAETYTRFHLFLFYPPSLKIDRIQLSISTGSINLTGAATKSLPGSFLQLDNLTLTGTPLSISEQRLQEGIVIEPNPSNGIVNISNRHGSIQALEIVNAMGLSIYKNTTVDLVNTTVDLSHHAKGLYILYAEMDNKIYSRKIILN